MLFRSGAAAGGAYALGNFSNNPPTELAYINAANDLTCLVMRTRPWLLTTVDHEKFTSSVADLLTKTDAMDKEYQKQVALSSDRTAFLKKTGFERSMHAKARTTLRKASNFDGHVNTAGFQLKNEANLVKNVADFEIHRNQLDLVNPKDALAGIRGTSQAFRDIKPLEVTPADAQKDADDEPKTNDMSDGVTTPNSATPQVTPTKTKVDASSTSTTASSELGKQADKLTQQITALSSQQAAQEKANDKRATATGKKLKELTDELKSLTVVVTALNASQTASLTVAISRPDTKAAEELALKLSDVLAAMRPVNAVLTRAYSLKPFVKNIPECQPLHAQYFEFAFDAEEVELNPGQSFDVALKGGVGVPRVWLSGAISTDKGDSAVLTTTIDGGIARAKLKLAADAPAGEMYIMAIDGSGRFKDSIKVVVVMPASPSKNK